ncbi:MAG: alanine--tRNA ligase, partial [Candidatus Omnitrophica bacterium]|nr:alanine--tRNA ligase [Candidatus Omnitrophota bacterium]
QQGSLVAEERLRFDFTHPKALTEKEKEKIEDIVNTYVQQCLVVNKKTMSLNDAKNDGALAFFAEKYSNKVRVVAVGNVSKELCGGTHLDNPGQIGVFKILNESAIAQGIRRIEATTGRYALKLIREADRQMLKIADILRSPREEIIIRLEMQTKKIKELEKQLSQSKVDALKQSLDDIIKKAKAIGSLAYISAKF